MKNSVVRATGLLLVLSAALVLAACGQTGSTTADGTYTIEVSGSTSVYPLIEQLASAFTAAHTGVRINANGTGSTDGITAAQTGTSEVGMSSRELKISELGYGLDELVIAVDAIAVVVHPTNVVSNLSIDMVRRIYTGEVTNWSQVGGPDAPIAVVSREPGSGTRGAFEEVVGFPGKLVAGAIEFDGTGGVRASVAGNPNAIGYVSLGSLDANVKALTIDGVEASSGNVVNGSYKVARPFILLYRENKISEQTRAFFDWVLSPEGQNIVGRSYVKVN